MMNNWWGHYHLVWWWWWWCHLISVSVGCSKYLPNANAFTRVSHPSRSTHRGRPTPTWRGNRESSSTERRWLMTRQRWFSPELFLCHVSSWLNIVVVVVVYCAVVINSVVITAAINVIFIFTCIDKCRLHLYLLTTFVSTRSFPNQGQHLGLHSVRGLREEEDPHPTLARLRGRRASASPPADPREAGKGRKPPFDPKTFRVLGWMVMGWACPVILWICLLLFNACIIERHSCNSCNSGMFVMMGGRQSRTTDWTINRLTAGCDQRSEFLERQRSFERFLRRLQLPHPRRRWELIDWKGEEEEEEEEDEE